MLENLYLSLARHKQATKETRGKVGLRAGVTECRLSKIVHGTVEPTAEERAGLAKALDLDESYLFAKGEQQPAAATRG